MARANLVLLLVVSLLVMLSVAESKRLTFGFAGKKTSANDLECNSVYGAHEGDTCGAVAGNFGLSLDDFLAINPNINCDSFFVGQWLCLAGGEVGESANDLVCNSVIGAEEGDTCGAFAQRFGLSLDDFLAINPNINCDSFFVGQWLCISGSQ